MERSREKTKGRAVRKSTAADKPRGRTRCAIYTRKSSEDGLDQDFNSLDAQREACAAFIASQRHEGWVCLPQMYQRAAAAAARRGNPKGYRGFENKEKTQIFQ